MKLTQKERLRNLEVLVVLLAERLEVVEKVAHEHGWEGAFATAAEVGAAVPAEDRNYAKLLLKEMAK